VAGGTIDATGLYTAPSGAADAAVFHIVATSVADPSKSATALVTIQTPVVVLPSSVNISIAVSTTQQFTATVRATSSTNVTWSVLEGAAGGTIDATGLYTAPATTGTYHVVAASVADPTQTGRATVFVGP
jgi:hypothetical protein